MSERDTLNENHDKPPNDRRPHDTPHKRDRSRSNGPVSGVSSTSTRGYVFRPPRRSDTSHSGADLNATQNQDERSGEGSEDSRDADVPDTDLNESPQKRSSQKRSPTARRDRQGRRHRRGRSRRTTPNRRTEPDERKPSRRHRMGSGSGRQRGTQTRHTQTARRTAQEALQAALQEVLDESGLGNVKAQIKALSASAARRLAETSEAVQEVLDTPPMARGDEEPPMIVPVDWLQAVLYICVTSWGRPTKIRATEIYDHAGSSIRRAGITTLQTTQMEIHPGRYDPERGIKPKTEYVPQPVAIEATVAWLRWDRRGESTDQLSIDWPETDISEGLIPDGLTVDALADLLQAIAQALRPETTDQMDGQVEDSQVDTDTSWTGTSPVSDIYGAMTSRYADAVKEQGGILNVDTPLFEAEKRFGPPLLTLSDKARQWIVSTEAKEGDDDGAVKDGSVTDECPTGKGPDCSGTSSLSEKLLRVENHRPYPTGPDPQEGPANPCEGPTPTTNSPPKDLSDCSDKADNGRLQRSDRSCPSFAVGRKSGVTALFEDGGIRFKDQWMIRHSQAIMIAEVTSGLSDATHHFFVHAVRSSSAAQKRSGGWFPFYYKHIRKTLPVSDEEFNRTELVWRPLAERELIAYRTHHSGRGRARSFHVDPEWLTRFHEVQFDGSDANDSITVDAFTGQRKARKPRRTRCHDRNRKKYTGSLMEGLQVLKGTAKRFDKVAVEAHLVDQKRKMEAARLKVRGETTADFRNHMRSYFDVADAELERHGWPTGVSLERWKMIYPGQRYTDAFLTHRQLQKAYLNDLRCYAAVIRQRPRHVRGPIWTYDTAWRVQDISGRVSEQGGALQSCSREMKAAAFARLEDEGTLYNYDIASSQLQDVIDATEPVAEIDTAILRSRYLDVPKKENADQLGISRDTYKNLLYLTTYQGSWKDTLQKAVRSAYRCLPEAVRIVRRAAWTEGDVDADTTYAQASTHFQPLHEAVRKLADYLLSDYWETHKYNASGYVMRNACGRPFRKRDYVKREGTELGAEAESDADDATTCRSHATRSKVLAWYLQGREADKMHRLAARCADAGIRVEGNEHDGIITGQSISESIQRDVLPDSTLEIKLFSDYVPEGEPPTDEELQKLRNDLNKQLGE